MALSMRAIVSNNSPDVAFRSLPPGWSVACAEIENAETLRNKNRVRKNLLILRTMNKNASLGKTAPVADGQLERSEDNLPHFSLAFGYGTI
jgi:hypothetical protein